MTEPYSSDSPIHSPELDKFGRWPFAQRVARVIAERKDPSSIVIGIYGAWGEGKTTVFNFIEEELKNDGNTVCLHFNPWRFGEEEQMLKTFFFDLATAVDRTIISKKEKIGDFIRKFGKPTAEIFGKGRIAEGVSSFFSAADLVKLRQRIEDTLQQEKRRVVVLVDDIDRLDTHEIHAVFRLVKLTADFKYTAYVLAFDHEMVASVLQERYGTGNKQSGKAFLEKIIQVPLQLPAAGAISLRKFCFDGIEHALTQSGIELNDEQKQAFVNHFIRGIERQLKTPRQAKLYSNILTFSLPILKSEVNPVDLMLIEAVRVFYPELYEIIRTNSDLFLNEQSTVFRKKGEEEKEKLKNKIRSSLVNYSEDSFKDVQELLKFLFPRLNDSSYGSSWDKVWEKNQRICSDNYFNRYFSYTVPEGDIADQEISKLITETANKSKEDIQNSLLNLLNEQNADSFIMKLRGRVKDFNNSAAEVMISALVPLGDNFPHTEALFDFRLPFSQAAMLINDLIDLNDDRDERIRLSTEMIKNATPLSFASECYRWLKRDTVDRPNPRGFSADEQAKIASELALRIAEELKQQGEDFIKRNEKNVLHLLFIWNKFGTENEAKNFIKELFEKKNNLCYGIFETIFTHRLGFRWYWTYRRF
ncbi:P-loop NTPase fold protein [Paenibacillus sp. D51F]